VSHFMCDDCFSGHVRAATDDGGLRLFRERGGVCCPDPSCTSQPFSDKALAASLSDDQFAAYARAKEKLAETRIAAQLEAEYAERMNRQIDELKQRAGGDESSGFDTLGVLSYTEELPGGMAGKPFPVDVVVHDGRPAQKAGAISLAKQGFALVPWPTRLSNRDFYNPKRVERDYYREMEELIKRETGAERVVVLNNIVRNAGKADKRGNDNPFAGGGNGVNGYANVVHTDFRAKKSVEKFYQQPDHRAMASAHGRPHAQQGKYMLLNAWRNISDKHPIYNNTLACCDQQTIISPDDYISVDVPLTPEAHAEQYRLASHTVTRHRWFYYPHMMKDEVLLFTQFDSDPSAPARFCFHTAFSDPTVDPTLPTRESVEVRAIAFFATPTARELGGRALADAVRELHPGDAGALLKQLAQAASRGILHAAELEYLADQAAFGGAQNEEYIMQLAAERRIDYVPAHWQPGPEADEVLAEMGALKAFERTKFLQPPKQAETRAEARADVAELRRMFPDVDPDAVLAVYTGFAGNFETTYEMLTLALAENRARVHHGRDEHDDD
jgi:hypothetical protein